MIILLMTITTEQALKIKIHVNNNEETNINYEGIILNNNKLTIKTNVNGHKVRIKSPMLSKNKYLKLVNVVI